jgi:hypothetical protein
MNQREKELDVVDGHCWPDPARDPSTEKAARWWGEEGENDVFLTEFWRGSERTGVMVQGRGETGGIEAGGEIDSPSLTDWQGCAGRDGEARVELDGGTHSTVDWGGGGGAEEP